MITVKELKKQFWMNGKALPILDVPKWEVTQGQRVAITGPSGSGKSTLLHVLSGVIRADEGELLVNSEPLHKYSEGERDIFRSRQVGYVLQDFHLIPSLSAEQNIELVMPSSMKHKERRRSMDEWLERVGMQDRSRHLPSQLSRGQQQRIAMVRALINHPRLILADEPTGSLDWETAQDIMRLLLELCEKESLTLITVTHDQHLSSLFPTQQSINDINKLVKVG
ncbi:ABC transporter ATP-binding protein YtrE [compost metagenome]